MSEERAERATTGALSQAAQVIEETEARAEARQDEIDYLQNRVRATEKQRDEAERRRDELRATLREVNGELVDAVAARDEALTRVERLWEWRERLWNEVHSIDGPRKDRLVLLGKQLDQIHSSGSSRSPEARSEAADLASPPRSDHRVTQAEAALVPLLKQIEELRIHICDPHDEFGVGCRVEADLLRLAESARAALQSEKE